MSSKTDTQSTLSFHVSGMHCASCATNISRKLSKTTGVTQAAVNYANEQATVTFNSDQVTTDKLVAAVSSVGYVAHIEDDGDIAETERAKELLSLKSKLKVSGVLAALLMASMLPGVPEFLHNPWILMALATPVQFWVGKRFYQGAWSGLQNLSANMDTLVALGTSVAYFYSVVVTIFSAQFMAAGIETHVYFEASAAIITFILLGKYLEIRAKAQTSSAIKELLNLQAKTALIKKGGESPQTKSKLVIFCWLNQERK